MNLAIIADSKSLYVVKRLKEEAEKLTIFDACDIYSWKEVSISKTISELEIFLGSKNIKKYSHLITRISENYQETKLITTDYAQKNGIKTINADLIKTLNPYTKLFEYYLLSQHNIPILPFSQTYSKDKLSGLDFPLVIKKASSNRARHVWKANNKQELLEKIERIGLKNSLIQKYAVAKEDIRIIVLGGKIVGAYKRKSGETFITTKNGTQTNYKPDDKESYLALRAAKVLNADYLGVDIIYWNKKPYILEVNIDAGIKTFEKVTGINLAKKIIDFIK